MSSQEHIEHVPGDVFEDGHVPLFTATRRTFILGSMAFLAGCASTGSTDGLPSMIWSEPVTPSKPVSPSLAVPSNLDVISRSTWARGTPIPGNMNRMTPVQRITIHHDGMNAFTTTSRSSAAARLERIRRGHLARGPQRWGDIGYHYAIDPSGRTWECRPLSWQGAHVKNQNPGNLGILVMGNYDDQSLTLVQKRAVLQFVSGRMRAYGVPASRLHTHQELAPTACPGRSLQAFMVSARSNRQFG